MMRVLRVGEMTSAADYRVPFKTHCSTNVIAIKNSINFSFYMIIRKRNERYFIDNNKMRFVRAGLRCV